MPHNSGYPTLIIAVISIGDSNEAYIDYPHTILDSAVGRGDHGFSARLCKTHTSNPQ
jgi:hypothetical protein